MRIDKPLHVALAVTISTLALAACDRESQHTAGQKLDNAMARTKEDLARAGDKIKPTLDKAGEKIAEASHSDAAITTSIKADYLKDPDLSVFKIDVDTKDGVVVLNGVTETPAARTRAEKLASSVKGVKEVKNHLTVKQG